MHAHGVSKLFCQPIVCLKLCLALDQANYHSWVVSGEAKPAVGSIASATCDENGFPHSVRLVLASL